MKIALCLSGHLRAYKECFPSLKKFIIDPYKPDVFIYTYPIQGFDGIRGDRSLMATMSNKKELIELYDPIKLTIDPLKNLLDMNKYKDRIGSGVRDPTVIPSMFHGIYRANQLKVIWEIENAFKYDIVIRSRADIMYETMFGIKEFEACQQSNGVYFPAFGNYGGLNDQFAFGNSFIMDLYSSTFPNIDLFFDQGCLFHAETLTKWTIDYFGIPILRTKMLYHLQRADGTVFKNANN